ncbi:MAG: hypothetical protein U9Q73_00660 [Nanoarchaeota archaeon]|nr:hypothetical protein [Nanoarchaeota archaeon]
MRIKKSYGFLLNNIFIKLVVYELLGITKMIKEMDVIFTGIWMILFLVIANGAYLLYQTENPIGFISGNSIEETVRGFYEISSVNHRILIAFQFFLVLVIVVSFFMIIRKFKSKKKLLKSDFIIGGNTNSKTDLDTLYEILKHKKEIDIEDIGKVFKVNREVALEWSKILENGNLAIIDYPGFGRPVLKLLGENKMDESLSKNNVMNKQNVGNRTVKNKIKEGNPQEVVQVKKVVSSKKISKKETKRNLKIKKRAEKKARKNSRKIEKIKKIKKKSKKR